MLRQGQQTKSLATCHCMAILSRLKTKISGMSITTTLGQTAMIGVLNAHQQRAGNLNLDCLCWHIMSH